MERNIKATKENLRGVIDLAPTTIMIRFRLPETDPLYLPNTKSRGKHRYFNPDELKEWFQKK